MDLKELAVHRESLHLGQKTHRPLSEDYEVIGLAGELEFAEFFGLDVDLSDRIAGDNGRDFAINTKHGRFHVDVKTAQKPFNLIVEEGKCQTRTIYVLAKYLDNGRAKLLGWEWGARLIKQTPRDFGYGVKNHAIPAKSLRSIYELEAIQEKNFTPRFMHRLVFDVPAPFINPAKQLLRWRCKCGYVLGDGREQFLARCKVFSSEAELLTKKKMS